ncbi:MAG: glycogen/starch synthase [Candidatus Micrarchaeota archaeon]
MPDYVFEVSSEAGRKIGGIYTVLRSKSAYMKKKYKDNYILFGYYDELCENRGDFLPEEIPKEFKDVFTELRGEGITCKYGRWTKGNNVRIIHVDSKKFGEKLMNYEGDYGAEKWDKQSNYVKYFLWKNYGVDSLSCQWDFTEYVTWAYAVGIVIKQIMLAPSMKNKKVVVGCHEWLAGTTLLYCKMKGVPVKTLFTTHATTLGRSIAMSGRNLTLEAYNNRGQVIDQSEAQTFKVQSKHLLEVACAKNTDVFTTVSETVAVECEYILGKKPDVITLNGFNFGHFEVKRKKDKLVKYVRKEMMEFLESYFVPYYAQSYKDAIVIYVSGRYEYVNKGFDVYIYALGKLNRMLKGGKRRIFAFIFAPSGITGPKPHVVSNYLLFDKIREMMDKVDVERSPINLHESIRGVKGDIGMNLRTMAKSFKRVGENPPITCFDLKYQEDDDVIIKACKDNGLTNKPEDPVKIIYYPTYLSAADGLLSMSYYDLTGGTDIGIFPSRYEPYGLTPVEAGAKYNVAITSDSTGFGQFIKDKLKKKSGIKVIKMLDASFDQTTDELADILKEIYYMKPKQFEELKEDAFKSLNVVDWSRMMELYYKAYELAESK